MKNNFNTMKNLYELAYEFLELEPWKKITDNKIFGVKHPQTGELNFCSVVGNGGEVFSLNIFPGIKGYISLSRIFNPEYMDHEMAYTLNSLMVDFVNPQEIDELTVNKFKLMDIDYQKHSLIPAFRSYKEGYMPWDISDDEIDLVTPVLEQAIIMCKDIMSGEKDVLPNSNENSTFLFRIPENTENKIIWDYDYINHNFDFKSFFDNQIRDVYYNEVLLKKIQKRASDRSKTIEMDYFFYPVPTLDEGADPKNSRPAFPIIIVCADSETEMILENSMVKFDELNQGIINTLTNCMENNSLLPIEVKVIRYELEDLILPISQKLQFEVSVEDELPVIDTIEGHFIQMLQDREKNK